MNGDTSIRPYLIGTSSGTRVRACASSSWIGSERSAGGSNTAWFARGTVARASLPRSTRSATVRWGAAAEGRFRSGGRVVFLEVARVLTAQPVSPDPQDARLLLSELLVGEDSLIVELPELLQPGRVLGRDPA